MGEGVVKHNSFVMREIPGYLEDDLVSMKTISDPVHGHIAVHPLCMTIIDTPQFQRLRSIKQCGFLDYVYPGATHNRFCHSIGVSYLAGRFVRSLRDNQPNLGVSEKDVLCVEIAGLCHDLGHGPFSHTWEIMMKMKKSAGDYLPWKHEDVSINMLDYLIEVNDLRQTFKDWGIEEIEIATIKNMILGKKDEATEKHFLFQIINNDNSGLDVDKWDYYLRDCYYLGLPCRFDYKRLLLLARVISVDGMAQICFRDKEIYNVFEMFRIRSELHRTAYQHRFGRLVESLFAEILNSVDGKTLAPNGEVYSFWEWSMGAAAIKSDEDSWEAFSCRMARFELLTDTSVVSAILNSSGGASGSTSALKQFSLLHNRPALKKYFTFVGEAEIPHYMSENDITKQFLDHLKETKIPICQESTESFLGQEHVLIQVVNIHWGKGKMNPLNAVCFYSKRQPNHAQPMVNRYQNDLIFPSSFQQVKFRLYSRNLPVPKLKLLRLCFEAYCQSFFYSCV